MSKYSQKIESWMNKNNHLFNKFEYMTSEDSKKSPSLKNIHESFVNTAQKKHTIQLVQESSLKPLHKKNYYPLMYVFYYNLQQTGLLDNIIKSPPNFTLQAKADYHIFTNWYHDNIDLIDHDQIHKTMDILDVGDTEKYQPLIDIYRIIYKTTGDRKLLHDIMYDNQFMGIDIQNEMESHEIHFKKYLIDDKHTVNIFIPISNDHSLSPNIELIAMIIDAMDNLSKKYNVLEQPDVELTICYTNKKKSIVSHNKTLGPNNINSGASLPGHYIICWRQEELYKVLIHELIHFYKLDFYSSDPMYDKLDNMVTVPKVIGSDKLNESYTETLAIIIMCIFITIKHNEEHFQYDFFIDLIKKEVIFLMFQFAKVLNKFGTSLAEYYADKIVIEQTTSYRSYFIIKMILLLNLQDLIQFMDNGLVVHNTRFTEFGNLINESYEKLKNNREITNIIDEFMIVISNHKTEESWIYWTMRMSANDLE